MSKITESKEFIDFTKVLYMKIILEEIKKDPSLWETFSHEKQVELHKIKDELNQKYRDKNILEAIQEMGF